MTSNSLIQTEVIGGLGIITLDRAKALNALTHAMVLQLADALRAFAADEAVEQVLITGAGDRALCAGGDGSQELAADILVPEVLASIGEWGPTPLPEPPKVSEAVEETRFVTRLRRRLTHR